MFLARVEGNLVATRKHPSFEAWRLVICQPMGTSGELEGAPIIAIDAHGAGNINSNREWTRMDANEIGTERGSVSRSRIACNRDFH